MTALQRVLKWHPPTPFFYGWLILFTAALGAFVATSIAGVVLGGIQTLITEETGWTRSTIGVTAAAGVWLSGFLGPPAGRLADRYGARWLMPIGTIVLGLCLYALGGANSVWLFFVLAVVARGVSQPLLIGVVPRTVAVNFFLRHRNLALALTSVFRPVSGAIIIQVILLISVAQGWRAAFRYLGIMSLLLTLLMVLVVRRRPEDIGLLPDGGTSREHSASQTQLSQPGRGSVEAPESGWTAGQALRTRAFWLIALTVLLGVTADSGIGFSLVPYLRDEAGLSTRQAAGVLSFSTFLSLASLGWGYLADRFTPRKCMVAVAVCSAGIIWFMLAVNSLGTAYLFGVLWGVFSSAMSVLIYMLIAQYYGRRAYGTISGSLRPFEAGGLGLGQSVGPLIYDVTASYRWLIGFAITAHLLAAFLIFFARPPAPPRQPSSSSSIV